MALDGTAEIGTKDETKIRVQLRLAIEKLPPKMKACFVLHAEEGFKQREIAEMLGMKEGTVKVHVFRAKALLREALAPFVQGMDRDGM